MKALLDHLCVHWMVHRPDDRMFQKKAVILTNAIGWIQGGAQKDIATSLKWLGVSQVKKLEFRSWKTRSGRSCPLGNAKA